jgi:hypothetical protein
MGSIEYIFQDFFQVRVNWMGLNEKVPERDWIYLYIFMAALVYFELSLF